MKKLYRILSLILLLCVICYPLNATYAAVPHLINYQGRLTDTSGSPLNGTYAITFRIYDAETAGNLLWQGTYTSVSITKGIFNILLGDISDAGFNFANLVFDKPYWLEIKVGTDNPMQPRQRITSAGYAIRAEKAEVAEDAKVRISSSDTAPGYLSDKIDNSSIGINGSNKLQVKSAWKHSGTQVFSGPAPKIWTDLNLSGYVGNNIALVMLRVVTTGGQSEHAVFRPNGDTNDYFSDSDLRNAGAADCFPYGNKAGIVTVETDTNGIVEWRGSYGNGVTITLLGFIK